MLAQSTECGGEPCRAVEECCITASIVLLVHVSEQTVRIRPHAAGPVLTAQCSRGQQPTVQLWWMRAGSH